jgi:hypothetical protein
VFDLANGPTTNLDAALREFNTLHMGDARYAAATADPAEEGLGRVLNNARKSAFAGKPENIWSG